MPSFPGSPSRFSILSSPSGLSCCDCSMQPATRIFGLDPGKKPANPALNRTAQKLRFGKPSALRTAAAS